ncbi:MAG: OmpH family outer membrane protein [bacterium]|nr:OmpH family outer membrane protein [bacterium]
MNRILIGVNAILVVAVAFLFYKVNLNEGSHEEGKKAPEQSASVKTEVVKRIEAAATPVTGKIAFIDIDRLNEESLEIGDLVAETKRRKTNIEASVESLSMRYQKKVEEFQLSQKAGIASQSELEAKAREIQEIEKEAQNKQLQMDNLSMDINDKNIQFQKNVKNFLINWNKGRYDFILSYSDAVPSMLLGNTTLEVTDEIIKSLNEEYKAAKSKK